MTDMICQVGQLTPCGKPARWVIAAVSVRDNVWTDTERPGGVIPLCEFHATTPATGWDEAP